MKIRLIVGALFLLALLPAAGAGRAQGAFPGNNGKIAFHKPVSYPGIGVDNIFSMNADGSERLI